MGTGEIYTILIDLVTRAMTKRLPPVGQDQADTGEPGTEVGGDTVDEEGEPDESTASLHAFGDDQDESFTIVVNTSQAPDPPVNTGCLIQ